MTADLARPPGAARRLAAASPRTRPRYLARLLVAAGADVTVVMTASADPLRRPRHVRRSDRQPRAHVALGRGRARSCTSTSRTRPMSRSSRPATANMIAKLAHGLADDLLTRDRCSSSSGRSSSRPPCTPACGRTRRRRRTSRRSPRAAFGSSDPSTGAARARRRGRRAASREPEDIVATVRRRAPTVRRRGARPRRTPRRGDRRTRRTSRSTRCGSSATAPAARWASRSPREAAARGADGACSSSGPATSRPPPGVDADRASTTAEEMRDGRPGERRRRRCGRDGRRRRRLPSRADAPPTSSRRSRARRSSRSSRRPTSWRELGERGAPARCSSGSPPRPTTSRPPDARKLDAKGLDLLVANEVGRAGNGFGADTNDATILERDRRDEPLRDLDEARARRRASCDRLPSPRGTPPSVAAVSRAGR